MPLLILLGLLTYSTLPTFIAIDPKVASYVQEIGILSNGNLGSSVRGIGFMTFADSNVLGRCRPLWKEIQLSETYWNNSEYKERIILLAHEIAHCEKRIGHINGQYKGCPDHFMSSHDGGFFCNNKYWYKYIKQMKEL